MTNLDKLLLLVDEEIQNNPVSHLGMVWCALSQEEIAERLGVSKKTVQRVPSAKAIQRFVHKPKGQRLRTLLRRADGKTTAEFRAVRDQRIMKAEYLNHTKNEKVPPKAYGCLRELCLTWPEKERLAIFRHTMRPANWRAFMASYKHVQGMLYEATKKIDDPEFEDLPAKKKIRHYKYPSIYVLVDGREVAKQCYDDHLQATGKALD